MSFFVDIASVPDRHEVVAEIWHKHQMVAEVRKATDATLVLELYPAETCGPWSFDLEEWLAALYEAKRRLL